MGQLQERYKNYRVPQKFMEADVYPYFREITSKQGTEVEMGGHNVLMFGSNAYTGLTGDQRIIDAAKKALDKYGSGCAGSRFLNGTLDLHVQLEKELAEFVGKVIAVIHRLDDVEDKWVIAPEGAKFTKDEIMKQVEFQERFFRTEIIM